MSRRRWTAEDAAHARREGLRKAVDAIRSEMHDYEEFRDRSLKLRSHGLERPEFEKLCAGQLAAMKEALDAVRALEDR